MGKDPAALLYIDKWIVATTEMKADARGYYMDLILHQFDSGDLPNDIEELANICRVRFSEFNKFEQVFEQVLKHKFEINENGRLEQAFAREIIQKRQKFIEKRAHSGKISYVTKFATKRLKMSKKEILIIKEHFDVDSVDLKNEQVLEQVLKQTVELYINTNEDINTNTIKDSYELFVDEVSSFVEYDESLRSDFIRYWTELNKSKTKMKFQMQDTFEISKRLVTWKKNDFGSSTKSKQKYGKKEFTQEDLFEQMEAIRNDR